MDCGPLFFSNGATVVRNYDCIIVGGGAIGLAIAYELSKGDASVAVYDAARSNHQASWAAAGIIPPADSVLAHDGWQRLVARGHQLHPIWAEELFEKTGIDVEYVACGAVHFAQSTGESASLRAVCQQWRRDGIPAEGLDEARLLEIEPRFSRDIIGGDDFYACWLAAEARIRPPRFLKALKRACVAQGVTLVDQLVHDWVVEDGRLVSVTTDQGAAAAQQFCLASGHWTVLNLKRLGIRIEMKPWRGQVLLLHAKDIEDCPGVILNEGPNYLVPRSGGKVVVGSTVEDVGFESGTTEVAADALMAFARQVIPQGRFQVEAQWSGLRPGTGDGFPYFGFVPGIKNLFVAAGHYRSGISMSPATAEIVCASLLGQHSGDCEDLYPFRLDRESN